MYFTFKDFQTKTKHIKLLQFYFFIVLDSLFVIQNVA